MTNEISITTKQNLPAFLATEASSEKALADKLSQGMTRGPMLPSLSVAGKCFSIRIGNQKQVIESSSVDIIIVDSRSSISKMLYQKVYNPNEAAGAPDCASVDGVEPDFTPAVIDPERKCACHECRNCYFNKFGTAQQGQGKACKDYKRLVVMLAPPEGTPVSPNAPALTLDVPATSFHAKAGTNHMMLREFLEHLARGGVSPSMVVATLKFVPESPFSQLTFTPKRYVTEAEFNRVKQLRADEGVVEAIESKSVKDEAPAPQPATFTPSAQSAPAFAEPTPAAQPTWQSYDAPAAEPAPAVEKPKRTRKVAQPLPVETPAAMAPVEAVVEAAETPAPAEEVSDQQVMDEISALVAAYKGQG